MMVGTIQKISPKDLAERDKFIKDVEIISQSVRTQEGVYEITSRRRDSDMVNRREFSALKTDGCGFRISVATYGRAGIFKLFKITRSNDLLTEEPLFEQTIGPQQSNEILKCNDSQKAFEMASQQVLGRIEHSENTSEDSAVTSEDILFTIESRFG